MSTAPSHSTLEVDPNPLHYGSSGLELQKPPAEEQYLYPVQYEHTYTTSNAYAAQEMQKQGGRQDEKGRLICGMKRPMVYLIAIIAILAVVGAIVGGVVGSRHGQQQQDEIMNQTFNILPTSSLAVSNLTTSTTYERNVFFQDAYNALILRRFNSTTNAWETRNISDSMVRTIPLDLPPGTPLASMSCNDWGCKNSAAFFLTSNNSIRGVTNAHITDGTYKYHVQTAQANLNATAGSKLAAAYHANPAPGNPGFQILAYQGTEGSLTFANSSNFTEKPQDSTALPRVVSGSSLAMVPQLNSSLLSHLKVVAEATYSSTVGAMSSLDFDGQYWVTGEMRKHSTGVVPLLTLNR